MAIDRIKWSRLQDAAPDEHQDATDVAGDPRHEPAGLLRSKYAIGSRINLRCKAPRSETTTSWLIRPIMAATRQAIRRVPHGARSWRPGLRRWYGKPIIATASSSPE